MPHFHKVKRLHHHHHHSHLPLNQLPNKIIDEEILHRIPQYIKYFDYPLVQSIVDHSTDPLQNVSRQYVDRSISMSSEGRFVNHEMIIRRNGETTILRPKHDVVLANGFTPVIRPSSKLPSHQSLLSHSQINSSVSMLTKMSTKISEQTPIIKTKGKHRHTRKRCNQIYNQQINRSNFQSFNYQHVQKSNLLQLVEQALHNFIDRQTSLPPQPPPLMSVLPQFHNPQVHSINQQNDKQYRFEEPYFNNQPILPSVHSNSMNRCPEPFYDIPIPEQYHSFAQNSSPCFHSPMSRDRNYAHMSGYFFE